MNRQLVQAGRGTSMLHRAGSAENASRLSAGVQSRKALAGKLFAVLF